MHKAKPAVAGQKTLILHPTNLWLTIHESVGHPTELDRALGYEANYAGTSFLTTDKLGKFEFSAILAAAGPGRGRGRRQRDRARSLAVAALRRCRRGGGRPRTELVASPQRRGRLRWPRSPTGSPSSLVPAEDWAKR
jgi:hypothetical protein